MPPDDSFPRLYIVSFRHMKAVGHDHQFSMPRRTTYAQATSIWIWCLSRSSPRSILISIIEGSKRDRLKKLCVRKIRDFSSVIPQITKPGNIFFPSLEVVELPNAEDTDGDKFNFLALLLQTITTRSLREVSIGSERAIMTESVLHDVLSALSRHRSLLCLILPVDASTGNSWPLCTTITKAYRSYLFITSTYCSHGTTSRALVRHGRASESFS